MKHAAKWLMVVVGVASMTSVKGQKIDEERMMRDIEVSENVLSTLVRQKIGKRSFFPLEVKGTYTAGYGVTFRLPVDGGPMTYAFIQGPGEVWTSPPAPDGNMTYSFSYNNSREEEMAHDKAEKDGEESERRKG